jgi:integrase
MLWMKKNAYEDTTTKRVAKLLRQLARNTDFNNPEAIKTYVANKQVGNSMKENLIEAYDLYIHYKCNVPRRQKTQWNKPFYQRYDKLPKIPQEQKIDLIIAKCEIRMKLFLSMSKDMGTRPVELTWLKLQDINLQNGIVNITGAKHTVGRIGKLKPQTLEMLKAYATRKNLNQDARIFPTKPEYICRLYNKIRNRLANELKDPTIKQIRLYDFRHWKATMEYHKTKDLLHVKALLGHKDLRTTLRYTQLIETLANDEYHCKATTNTAEATNLIENGFEYVATTPDALMLFRKRK